VLLSEHVMELPTLPPRKITLYQCIIGKLLYAATCTCFDIMFSVVILGRYSHVLNSHYITMAKHVLGYLKCDSKKVIAYAYIDADFANTPGRKSVSEMTLSINYCLIV
jgi:hypothetical protein